MCLLTGLRPDSTGIYDLEHPLSKTRPDIVSLPHHFKNHGYVTVSLGKIYHHGNDDLEAWSKKPYRALKGRGYLSDESLELIKENQKINPNAGDRGPAYEMADVPDNYYSDGQIADKAIIELRNLKGNPFFLAVGFRKPHLPFTAPKKYWDLYDSAKIKLADNPFAPENVTEYSLSNYGELRKYYGITFVDIYPTLLDVCGLPKPDHKLEGFSFAPLLDNPSREWKKAAFSQYPRHLGNKSKTVMGYSMRTEHFHYIEWIHLQSGDLKARELYDHILDPNENINVVNDPHYSGTLKELEQILKLGWKGALPI